MAASEPAMMEVKNTEQRDSAHYLPSPACLGPGLPPSPTGPGPGISPTGPGPGFTESPPVPELSVSPSPPPDRGPTLSPASTSPGPVVSLSSPGPVPVLSPSPPSPGPVLPLSSPGTGPVLSISPTGPGPDVLPPPRGRGQIIPAPDLGLVTPPPGPVLAAPALAAPEPPPGSGPVLPPIFRTVDGVFSGTGGIKNTAPPPVLQQETCLISGLSSSQPAQLYSSSEQVNSAPVNFQPNVVSNLRPAGTLNGQPVYWLVPAAPQLHTISNSKKKRRRQHQQDDDQPRVKKPLNAFMLYLKEQRRNMEVTDSAEVNKVLGDRWNQLSKEQQAKYFEQAQREARLHAQQYPDWSPSGNSTTSGKRERRSAQGLPTSTIVTTSLPQWSPSTHFDGQSYKFDNVDQLVTIVDGELAVEKPSVPDSALVGSETAGLSDSTAITPGVVEPGVSTPNELDYASPTELKLQYYSCDNIDQLVSVLESEAGAVIIYVPDSTTESPGHSAATAISDGTAETPSSQPNCHSGQVELIVETDQLLLM